MTPVDELVLSKLNQRRFDFTERELKYLIDLVMREVNRSYGVFN